MGDSTPRGGSFRPRLSFSVSITCVCPDILAVEVKPAAGISLMPVVDAARASGPPVGASFPAPRSSGRGAFSVAVEDASFAAADTSTASAPEICKRVPPPGGVLTTLGVLAKAASISSSALLVSTGVDSPGTKACNRAPPTGGDLGTLGVLAKAASISSSIRFVSTGVDTPDTSGMLAAFSAEEGPSCNTP